HADAAGHGPDDDRLPDGEHAHGRSAARRRPQPLSHRRAAAPRGSRGACHARVTPLLAEVTDMRSMRRLRSAAGCLALAAVPSAVAAGARAGGGPTTGPEAAPAGVGAPSFVRVAPFRILDTRSGIGTGGVTAPLGAGVTIDVQVAGVGTIPA